MAPQRRARAAARSLPDRGDRGDPGDPHAALADQHPQIGGGGLHIAHLLYGGIFMVIAIGLLLTLLGRGPRLP
jgi:hypothetical protein